MAPKLPALSARDVVSALLKSGFYVHHTTGSHVQIRHNMKSYLRVTVPNHSGDVPKRDLHSILRQTGLTRDEFLALF